jgi:hypothetical protein
MSTAIPAPGEMIEAWALHAGDRIAVAGPGDGTIAVVVVEIRHSPGLPDELDWEACDRHCHGCLHYSAADLVNRLRACKVAA